MKTYEMMQEMLVVIIFLIAPSICTDSKNIIYVSKIVNEVNSNFQNTWQASSYGFTTLNRGSFVQTRLGLDLADIDELTEIKENEKLLDKYLNMKNNHEKIEDHNLPQSFDTRINYPYCRSIQHIWDQSNCASCWAISASSVLSDRLCIKTKGERNVLLSIEHLIACNKKNRGCKGGGLQKTWEFLQTQGTVTGGDFHSDEGCQPYSIRPCGWPSKLPCKFSSALTPKCKNTKCSNEWHDDEYEVNIVKAKSFYILSNVTLGSLNEILIMKEIYSNGPVQAAFLVYEDFLTYKSGIYQHKGTSFDAPLSGLSVKIIGWGEENGIKYWIAVNSWSEEWGENGTFRIIRGENQCLIETFVYTGVPELIT
ncbi:cathepsin B-like cysteine proteinase 4 [Planococcus citri]|uniref:cathepsin B-like cysteine proteinase 4 n=1 Tax=Planococcus citri TaxID=170843 RepID=UPI0031FA3933